MKRWLGAAACAAWLWAGAAAAGAEDLYLPGGVVLPMPGEVETASAETSFWGGLLAEKVRDAVSEEKLRGAIDSLKLYGQGDAAKRDRLAQIVAGIFAGGRFELVQTKEGGASGLLLSVYVTDAEKAEIETLLSEAREPDIPFKGAKKRLDREGITAGRFALVEASPMKSGVSSEGVPYKWGDASLTFAGEWDLSLPFGAVYAVVDGRAGRAYAIFLALPEGAAYFQPRLEKGLAEARDESPAVTVTAEEGS